jgi:hypothetical protein
MPAVAICQSFCGRGCVFGPLIDRKQRLGRREPQPLIDDVDERFADPLAADVLAEQVGHVVDAAFPLAADVRGDDHVACVPQGSARGGQADVTASHAKIAAAANVNAIDSTAPMTARGDADWQCNTLFRDCSTALNSSHILTTTCRIRGLRYASLRHA